MSIYEATVKNPKKIAEFYKQLSEQKDIEIKQLKEKLQQKNDIINKILDYIDSNKLVEENNKLKSENTMLKSDNNILKEAVRNKDKQYLKMIAERDKENKRLQDELYNENNKQMSLEMA